ncbi:DUF2170 family protein [Candidatus Venteria ishoeyi]|uniref:DUF2170 domain-containing protein n=1 Tax=Candidatus Venteria ishoeyi TaxID=1899563 RepID=A0A1H6FDV2_9GAMM|nr:DUF2170 family protein [Candidatus Venteria ishoeyi]MDM8545332.1 DUF2170 family protein [Candidatus Venteria ishoeyi]SEH07215.1 Uncharacterised protein [Candidatus Venteria ishoeyi]
MSYQQRLTELATEIDGAVTESELVLRTELIEGEEGVNVLIVSVEDREEFPVYITIDDSQVLCISHLWLEDEVIAEKRAELLDALLAMNVPMPLSSFSKLGDQYLIFGALSNQSSVNHVLEEIDMLSNNTLTAIEEFADFLQA